MCFTKHIEPSPVLPASFNFGQIIDRRGTGSYKWDFLPPGAENAIPLSLADMDFPSPEPVAQALAERVRHGIFGYTLLTDEDLEAVRAWCLDRHCQVLPPEWMLPTPGIVPAMRAVLHEMTQPGDGVVVQPPVHTPFFITATRFDRKLVENPLRQDASGYYRMDLDHLETCFRNGARVLLLCSPHNPVGRVWSADELQALAGLCVRYGARVISDEVHRDILAPGVKHTPIATLPGMEERAVTLFSPSKTFNLGGFHIATAVIADRSLREKTRQRLADLGFSCDRPTLMSIAAQTAAYRHGGEWLDALNAYIAGNMELAARLLDGLPVSFRKPEGSFMFWLDCGALRMRTDELMDFMFRRAGVLPEPGHIYFTPDPAYIGPERYLRFNAGLPRSHLEKALFGLRRALVRYVEQQDAGRAPANAD